MSTIRVAGNERKPIKQYIQNIDRFIIVMLLIVTISAAVTVGFYIYNFASPVLSNSHEQWGLLGDYIGGLLNPLIALAALSAVLFAIRIQKYELAQANEALNQTVNRMDGQLFDSKFFNMLSLYNESIKTIKGSFQEKEYYGYDAIKEYLFQFFHQTYDFSSHYQETGEIGFKGEFYPLLSGRINNYLGSATILMIVSRILDVVDNIESSKIDDKSYYHNLFCSYISKETKIWIYILFIFTKKAGKIPPSYGCTGMFLEYMHKELPWKVDDIPKEAIKYIATNIQSIVNETNTEKDANIELKESL